MNAYRWLWRCRVDRVVDGDTLDVTIDVGFRAFRTERLRLHGVNCPETKGETREAGLAAAKFTTAWLDRNGSFDPFPFRLETFRSDVFGRYLAIITAEDGTTLNKALLDAAMAVPFKENTR